MISMKVKTKSEDLSGRLGKNIPRVMRQAGFIGVRETKRLLGNVAKKRQTRFGEKQIPSAPGEPPRKRRGRLQASIRYAYDEESQAVVFGSRGKSYGWYGALLEHGGKFTQKGWKWKINPRKIQRGDSVPIRIEGGKVIFGTFEGSTKQRRRISYILNEISDVRSGKIKSGYSVQRSKIFERFEKGVEIEARPFVSVALRNIRSEISELFRNKLFQ